MSHTKGLLVSFAERIVDLEEAIDEALAVLRDVEAELTSVLGIVKPATRSRIAALLAKHKGEV